MPGTHTWTPAERRAALHFARSLDESHLEIARGVYRYPHASVEELINHMSDSREELSRLAVFDFKKQTMIAFFRDQIPTADLRMAVLRNTPVDELRGILYSYVSQGCRGRAKVLLTDDAQQRQDDADGLQREWSRMQNISFSSAARAQAQGLLLRLKAEELETLRQRLNIADADFGNNKVAQVQAILSAVEGQKGPHKLLSCMVDRHVRTFLSENWEQIAMINDPEASGYDTDPIDYDMHTCQLFILWSWAHM